LQGKKKKGKRKEEKEGGREASGSVAFRDFPTKNCRRKKGKKRKGGGGKKDNALSWTL